MACPSLSLKLEREEIAMVIGNAIIVSGGGSISPSDEGKVVSNGVLVAQGSQTITQNGTYDTTFINELIANISSGGEGALSILLDEEKAQESGSTLEIDKTIIIPQTGEYHIFAGGFVDSISVKINNVSQPLTFSRSSHYAYFYNNGAITLNQGDVVDILLSGSGMLYERALIFQTDENGGGSGQTTEFTGNNREYLFRVNFSSVKGWIHIARDGSMTYSSSLDNPIQGEFITVQSDGTAIATSDCSAVVFTRDTQGQETLYETGDNFPSIPQYFQIIMAWETGTSVLGDHEFTFAWAYVSSQSIEKCIINSNQELVVIPYGGSGDVFVCNGLDNTDVSSVSDFEGKVMHYCNGVTAEHATILTPVKYRGSIYDASGLHVFVSY